MTFGISSATARVSNNGTGTTVTTASFTPNVGDLLVACYCTTGSFSTLTDSQSGTWTLGRSTGAGVGNDASIRYRFITTSAGMTVTGTRGAGTQDASIQVYIITGARVDVIGAVNSSTVSVTNNLTASIFTSTVTGSIAVVAVTEYGQTGSYTSSDLTVTTYGSGLVGSIMSGFKTLGAPGAQTANLDAPGTTNPSQIDWAAVEFLPSGAPPPQQMFPNRIWRGRRR